MPERKIRRLNRSLSVQNIKIRLNQSFRYEPYFLFKILLKPFTLTIVKVVLRRSQRTDAAGSGSNHDAWEFPEELPGNSIHPLGSGQPI